MLESLWVKTPLGKNRGRWDAGFRSPFSGHQVLFMVPLQKAGFRLIIIL